MVDLGRDTDTFDFEDISLCTDKNKSLIKSEKTIANGMFVGSYGSN